jgi:alkanesulfonate monooxygenase SsuD/methylene tetrahydromethanopterin reductase-like flavin-dependent oxidoreductase (luciferase family)
MVPSRSVATTRGTESGTSATVSFFVMRFGVAVLPEHRWPRAREIFRRVEELGFDHAWTYDHLSWRTLRDGPWFGAIPLLSAVAAVTSRLRLGTLVASPNFRHPVPFAKELMSLDDVSEGRLTLGVGAGTINHDATVLGNPAWTPHERADRFEEFVVLLDELLTSDAVDHAGTFYAAVDARMLPGCVQQPRIPFAIAGNGPRGMRLVAEHAQTWVTFGDPARTGNDHFAGLPRLIAMVEAACADIGRDPATLDRLVLTGSGGPDFFGSAAEFTDAAGRYADLGFTDVVLHYPRIGDPYAGQPAVLEDIAAALALGDRFEHIAAEERP